MSASKCWKCGAQLREHDVYCSSCGARVAKVKREEFTISADNLIEKVKQLLHEGNVTRIMVKDDKGRELLEIPATIGIVGTLIAPWLAALGAIAAIATNCTLTVERRE